MPWYFPWPDSIKKRACRYLLQLYVGHLLEEKLTLQQLSVDLYGGTGALRHVALDVWSLNEMLDSVNAPLEITDGYIESISVSIPWSALLLENSTVEVRGLRLTLRPKAPTVSVVESLYWSTCMTSSMQLAQECLKQQPGDDQPDCATQQFEGLEVFAQTIDTVLRRVKLAFLDTVVRVEHVRENAKSGVALELRIKRMDYCDEAACEEVGDLGSGGVLGEHIDLHHPAAFARKTLRLVDVDVFCQEIPAEARTPPRTPPSHQDTEPKLSPSWNPRIVSEPHPQFSLSPTGSAAGLRSEPVDDDAAAPLITPPPPLQVASCAGAVEVNVQLKQNEALPGPKLEVKASMGSLNVFASPRQGHLLLDLFYVLWGPDGGCLRETLGRSRPMQSVDMRRIESQLHRQLAERQGEHVGRHVGRGGAQDDAAGLTHRMAPACREDEFFSMADMSGSVGSLPPLGEPPEVDLDTSFSSSTSGGRQWGVAQQPLRVRDGDTRHSTPHSSVPLTDDQSLKPELVLHLELSSASATVLHIDPLPNTVGGDQGAGGEGLGDGALQPPEGPLAAMSRQFFREMEEFGGKDFAQLREKFAKACPHDHFRLVGTSVRTTVKQHVGVAGRQQEAKVSVGSLEVLECLFETQDPASLLVNINEPQYTEVLAFEYGDEGLEQGGSEPSPCLRVLYNSLQQTSVQGGRARGSTPAPKATLTVDLGRAKCEFDISVVDRLSSVLHPQPTQSGETMSSHMYMSYNPLTSMTRAFTQVLMDDEASAAAERRTTLVARAPSLRLAVRFPIPDLRPLQERGPWFRKSLRPEVLRIDLTELDLQAELGGGAAVGVGSADRRHYHLQFRELHGLFEEGGMRPPVPFLRVSPPEADLNSSSEHARFDWPRVVLSVNSQAERSVLEPTLDMADEPPQGSLDDACTLNGSAEPSPFSSRRVMFDNEEMVMPGDAAEMLEFQEKAMGDSHFVLELTLPNLNVMLPSKAFYERLYNRINNNLLLWEPAAPLPLETVESAVLGPGGGGPPGLSVASQLISSSFNHDAFLLCKSGMHDGDSESGSEDDDDLGGFMGGGDATWRHPRRRRAGGMGGLGLVDAGGAVGPGGGGGGGGGGRRKQSLFSMLVNIGRGRVTAHTATKDEEGRVACGRHGEVSVDVEGTSVFSVVQHAGRPDLRYVCMQANRVGLHHRASVENTQNPPRGRMEAAPRSPPPGMEQTIYRSEEGVLGRATGPVGTGGDSLNMLALAIKISADPNMEKLKEFLVAVGLRGATLRYRPSLAGQSWHEQVLDFLDVRDETVLGYSAPDVITVLHAHLWSCAVDYRPQYLPLRAMITAETFSVSSNIIVDTSTSLLRFIIDDSALYLSEKINASSVDLRKNYVCVLDMGLLELQITTRSPSKDSATMTQPKFELCCSNDIIHVRTCADSCAALMRLIQYFAGDGDLAPPQRLEDPSDRAPSSLDSQSPVAAPCAAAPDSDRSSLSDLMVDAMEESEPAGSPPNVHTNGFDDSTQPQSGEEPVSDLFLFPDENGSAASRAAGGGAAPPTAGRPSHARPSHKKTPLARRAGPGLAPPAPALGFAFGSGSPTQTTGASAAAATPSSSSSSCCSSSSASPVPPPRVRARPPPVVGLTETGRGGGGGSSGARRDEGRDDDGAAAGGGDGDDGGDGDGDDDDDLPDDDEFCILEAPGIGIPARDGEPVVKRLVEDTIELRDEHFSRPLGRADVLRPPARFPVPLARYTLREVSVTWHLYGGRDFGPALSYSTAVHAYGHKTGGGIPSPRGSPHRAPSGSKPPRSSWQTHGGPARNHDVLMEVQLNKVRFQHEVYSEPLSGIQQLGGEGGGGGGGRTAAAAAAVAGGGSCPVSAAPDQPVSRQVFIVQDLEVRDRLASSQINKFLYLYTSEKMPRKTHANMLTLKALHLRPESGLATQECCLRVSLMPLRLNIDQDALFFLKDFASSVSAAVEPPTPDNAADGRRSPAADGGTSPARHPSQPAPVMTYPAQPFAPSTLGPMPLTDAPAFSAPAGGTPSEGTPGDGGGGAPPGELPIFFREFRFTSEVLIRLDYHGKHVTMEQGTFAGILIGLAQLNNSELKLKQLCYRHGLLGVERLVAYAASEWVNDIRKNQLPGILGGVGPMHSLVQLVQGMKDLVWLPIEQYRKDGRIVRGIQRGAASFGTSTAMAALELTNRLVQTVQAAAETAYDMLSPGPSVARRPIAGAPTFPQHRVAQPPADLREGVAKAYDVVREGVTDTAQTLYMVCAREHEQKGVTGAVGGVLRQIPPTVVKPLIVASEATANVLGGMRNQIQPDARREHSQKWRHGDD
ncbi:autophagy-related protein 2 homolog B [Petromyzon marinus]|uniref:autophagy-related protein 2 homolog B n=1 Tax=Petromyzon marinus TaxID=7757 RepID=UPI003F7035E0